ncbi:hypothetical protein Pla108_10800 [Botrimarina colliarenosi]|uniref:Uncharacterized protein n=1 Tax=Botrimarina colliarenosi TaxID=2528001 RepID=A0A5C6ALU0_9BACT|nr:glycosyltransferase [Botrimarina colliarenosi]TWU00136.1 hypothetical protein Pla108_10800 [Botrimarina colliarenosi]
MPRLLIVAPTFFPDPGVQSVRVTQWARTLPDLGWETHILCRHYGYEATPERLAQYVHPDVRLHYLGPKRPAPPAGRIAGAPRRGVAAELQRQAERFFVPDITLLSWRRLAVEAVETAQSIAPDVILSSSPPHSIHWIGRHLAQATGAKWAADFRDPYALDDRFVPGGWLTPLTLLHQRHERQIYRDADLTIHAIPIHGRWSRRHYTDRRGPAELLPNGAPSDLQGLAAELPPRPPEAPLELRSVGQIADDAPQALYEAIKRLRAEGLPLRFLHAGHLPAGVAELPVDHGDFMTFLGLVPHDEAMRLVVGADLLLAYLSEKRSRHLLLTSKLFEYLGACKPVLVVNPTRPDRQFLKRRSGCVSVSHPNTEELATAIRSLAEPSRSSRPTELEAIYDRRQQTAMLSEWLRQLID